MEDESAHFTEVDNAARGARFEVVRWKRPVPSGWLLAGPSGREACVAGRRHVGRGRLAPACPLPSCARRAGRIRTGVFLSNDRAPSLPASTHMMETHLRSGLV